MSETVWKRISKRVVDAAKPDPDGGRYFIRDTDLSGFAILVLPTGAKSYTYQYPAPGGRSPRVTIAKVGTLTPEQARRLAEEMAVKVKSGGDPRAEKQAAREALSTSEVFDLYVKSERFAEKAPATQSNDRTRFERHLKPLLGNKMADTLTTEDARRAMRSIIEGKTRADRKTDKPRGRSRVRGGDVAARDCIALARSAWNWARSERLVKGENPFAEIRLAQSRQRETVISEPEQWKALFAALDRLESIKTISEPTADVFRLLALTGARKSEIAGARWRHVDMKAGTITLPPREHKTGRKTGKPRVITLPAIGQEIVAKQPAREPDDLIFKPARGVRPINLQRPWELVRTAAKLPDELTIHGLRHSLATALAVGGAQAAEIMAAVGHRQISTTARYIHFATNARAALAERAAAPALAGLAAAAGKPSAEVVPLDRKGAAK